MSGLDQLEQPPPLVVDALRIEGGCRAAVDALLHQHAQFVDGIAQKVTPFLRHDAPDDDNLADNTVAIFEYDRAIAVVETAGMEVQHSQRRQFEVVGNKGTIVLQPLEPPAIRLCLDEPQGGYQAGWQTIEVPNIPRYVRDVDDLARAIRGERSFGYSPEHDLTAQETLLRACGALS